MITTQLKPIVYLKEINRRKKINSQRKAQEWEIGKLNYNSPLQNQNQPNKQKNRKQ